MKVIKKDTLPNKSHPIHDKCEDCYVLATQEVIEKLERFFTPATGSRGQGGLPVTGSVIDWTYKITKDGWETFKKSIYENI